MRGAGPAGNHADAGPAREFAISLGHIGGGAFVLGNDQFDLVLAVQSIQDFQIALAGNAENAFDAVQRQGFHEDAARGQGLARGVGIRGILEDGHVSFKGGAKFAVWRAALRPLCAESACRRFR